MAKEYARSFYQSKAWEKTRRAYYYTQHGLCERCGRPGDIVHHVTYITEANINDPSVTMNHDNLELLCQTCHNREHMKTDPIRDGLKFSSDGKILSK